MKKRILAALVCAAMVLSLAGCAKNEGGNDTSSRTSTKSSSDKETPGESSSADNSGSGSESSSTEESKPEEPAKYPEATNVLYLQGEKLDFPETPATDFDYEIRKDQVYITEYFGKNPDVRIPETIDGKKVAGLSGDGIFNDHRTIKRLIVPDNVKLSLGFMDLESVTFLGAVSLTVEFSNSSNLTNVYFDGDIPNRTQLSYFGGQWYRSIQGHDGLCVLKDTLVFGARCSGDVVVPEGVTKIMEYAFNDFDRSVFGVQEIANLNSVTLPDGLQEIGQSAFAGTGLTSVNIPESVTVIGEKAFAKTKLETVKISDSVSQIGSGAFSETPYLNNLTQTDGMKIDGTWLLDGSGAFGHVVVPDGVKHIANGVFQKAQMQSITLPDGLVSIGESAFSGASFKDITLPDSVTDIGVLAFKDSSLFSLDKYKDSKGVVVIGQVAVIDNHYSGNYVVPDGVKKVSFTWSGRDSFSNVTITLPDSFDTYVTNIQNYCNTIIYKGNTYNILSNSSLDWEAERDAFKAAVEGN